MITPDTVVVGVDPRDMSRDAFKEVLAEAGSPALREGDAGYDVLSVYDVSIAFCLAVFHHESTYATNPNAIVVTHDTKNPGNCRSSRTGDGKAISTPRGPFVKYLNWADGWADLSFRLVDESYVYVRENRRTIRQVIERFAPVTDDNNPDAYVNAVVRDMNRWAEGEPPMPAPMAAQIPGFTWAAAQSDHYDRGRAEKIRGGAQHYTAGTHSLEWLRRTSIPPVSVHFLVKHEPTLEDRGWQLVKIEDTAWTTAFANPYTVAIEYEHDGKQSIPDIAYEVLAQSWVDIDAYVWFNGLGDIEAIKGHKEWVNNPRLICPDGIDIQRIVRRVLELQVPPAQPTSQFFDETGFTVGGGFLQFWKSQGGLTIFGYPITEEFIEQGHTVQYFERARFEHHPNTNPTLWDVMLGRVGAELIGYDGP
jgi:hypothetical protein